jgi:hypothetical protein
MIPYGPHRNHASGLLYPLKKKKKKKKKKKGGQGACAEVGDMEHIGVDILLLRNSA